MKNLPLLSICIPTHNRAEYLYNSLERYTQQEIFTMSNLVEIVVSDNCSSDNTTQIVRNFQDIFPNKIIYNRNNKNIGDANFLKVFTIANGLFLKLNNDTLYPENKESLNLMLEIIKANILDKPVIFFTNGNTCGIKSTEIIHLNNLNDFLSTVSFRSTWIGSFGIWAKDLKVFEEYREYSSLQLHQTKVLFELISRKKDSFIYTKKIFGNQKVVKKSGYNIAKVFGKNYLDICNEYLNANRLLKSTYEREKKLLLINHIVPCYFNLYDNFSFRQDGFIKYLWHYYNKNWYFYFFPLIVLYHFVSIKFKNLFKKILPTKIVERYHRRCR